MGQFLKNWKIYNTQNIQYMILMPKNFRLMQELNLLAEI